MVGRHARRLESCSSKEETGACLCVHGVGQRSDGKYSLAVGLSPIRGRSPVANLRYLHITPFTCERYQRLVIRGMMR